MIIETAMLENIILGVLLFILFIIGSWVGFVFYKKKRWPMDFELYENMSGQGYRKTLKGKCRLVTMTSDGMELYYLKGLNKFRPAFGKRMGINLIWWGKNRDGYWRNITMEDLDDKLMKIGVNIVDSNARGVYASMNKIIGDNFKSKNFMDKYGTIIAFGMLFLCIIGLGVSNYYGLTKVSEINKGSIENQRVVNEATTKTMEQLNSVLNKLEILKNTGVIISNG